MMIQFDIFGHTLQFDDSIKLYRNAVNKCRKHVKRVWDIYNSYFTMKDSNLEELDTAIKDMVIDIMDNNIKPYMKAPREEWFDSEEAYIEAAQNFSVVQQYMDLYENFSSEIVDIMDKNSDAEARWMRESYQQLQKKIDKITIEHEIDAANGLGFGILSNNMFHHIIYSAQSVRNVEKIENNCNEEIHKLKKEHENLVNNHRESMYKKNWEDFYPVVKKILTQIEPTLLLVLEKWQVISPNFHEEIDENKSHNIIKNISCATDKKTVILDALFLCPYNKEIYEVARNEQLIDDGMEKLIRFFS